MNNPSIINESLAGFAFHGSQPRHVRGAEGDQNARMPTRKCAVRHNKSDTSVIDSRLNLDTFQVFG